MGEDEIQVEEVPRCPLCGSEERKTLYAGLTDRLFGAPGEWTLKECRDCRTAFLDPRLTPENIGRAYETYCTHSAISENPKSNSPVHLFYRAMKAGYLGGRWGYSWGTKPWQRLLGSLLFLFPRRQAQLDFTVMYQHAVPGGRLLDVGCGSGELLERMQSLDWRVEGLDFDAKAVQVAQEYGLKVRLGTLEEQYYPEGSFDAITMSHVIEHVHDPLALLSECRRILKPGGCLVVVTPNLGSLGHNHFGVDWIALDPPRHLQLFEPQTLRRLAERSGFEKLDIRTTMHIADWIYETSSLIRRKGYYSWGEPTSLMMRMWGRTMQRLQWVLLKIRPNVGEEIVLTCEKS